MIFWSPSTSFLLLQFVVAVGEDVSFTDPMKNHHKLNVKHRELSSVLCDDREGWDGLWGLAGGRKAREGGDICVCIADSLCCTAETNPTL